MSKRKARFIKDPELKEILSLTPEDAQKTSVFMEYFGEFNGKKKYNTYDMIEVPPKTYHNNKNTFTNLNFNM